MSIRASGPIVRGISVDWVASVISFQPLRLETGALQPEERVIAVITNPDCSLEYYQRNRTDGLRAHWTLSIDVFHRRTFKIICVAQKVVKTVEPQRGTGCSQFDQRGCGPHLDLGVHVSRGG